MAPTSIAGRYTVLRAVGRGGMGAVWLCRDEVLGREVAVKQVGTLPGESTSDVHRALREARSSAALNHPHVVSIYDAVEDGDHNWLVMEYVPARTLAQILAAEGSITPERAARIGAQAADGLAAAHERGTVHRDVKPGNILVTDDDHVKIMDFGIARTHGDQMLTRTGLVIGTPSYLSPELARGDEPGLPADVWALGATLYAAVEGHPLYAERPNAISLITAIASEPAPPPQRADFLTDPITRMLDRDPVSRWSMQDAAHALQRLQAAHPSQPPREDTRTLTAVQATAPALVVEPVGAQSRAEEPATRERPRPVAAADESGARDRRPPRRWLLPLAALVALVAVAIGGYTLLDQDDPAPTPDAGGAEATSPAPETPATPATPETDTPSPDQTEPSQPTEPSEPSDPTEPTEPSEPTDAETTPAPSTDAATFVQQYYSLLPGDTRSAYDLLSPAYRSGTSYDSYRGFWATIGAVSVGDVVDPGDGTVDVTLTYTGADGRTTETRRIYLEQDGSGYLIADDEVPD